MVVLIRSSLYLFTLYCIQFRTCLKKSIQRGLRLLGKKMVSLSTSDERPFRYVEHTFTYELSYYRRSGAVLAGPIRDTTYIRAY